jgi:TctA family transporter
MKAQSINGGRRSQEYLTVGVVIAAGGVMFVAGSLQLTQTALMYSRWVAVILTVIGVFLVGSALGMRSKASATSKPVAAKAKTTTASKAASSAKRSARKK